ncbi:MerR family transcriptional regulator [Lancefieldella sp. Marseille-Q7238]|uniref:transcriptional regulator FtsR n=1 Tax=Lancefieldella sp. Marseille-Q7238 TaxID=3022127 RepID=UPI0024A9335B|nr:MerR family transcriptional regulator [Lancefieldella sp. Marseille-Q7238]
MTDASFLTIGKVVDKLKESYPDLTISKVRYLEDEGLLEPSRSSGGYRQYSQRDVRRLETILYLQKNRFMPLSVIREELERQDQGKNAIGSISRDTHHEDTQTKDQRQVTAPIIGAGNADAIVVPVDKRNIVEKFHSIDRMPDLVGASVGFVRQLSEVGIITLKRSPHGRDLVDGRDLTLIRLAHELRHFGFEPKNLRQYVMAANRESSMFAKSLVVYAKKGGGVEVEANSETRRRFMQAFTRMLGLTNAIRNELITRLVSDSFKDMEMDSSDREIDSANQSSSA